MKLYQREQSGREGGRERAINRLQTWTTVGTKESRAAWTRAVVVQKKKWRCWVKNKFGGGANGTGS